MSFLTKIQAKYKIKSDAEPKDISSIWDDGKTIDRYTIVFNEDFMESSPGNKPMLGLSADPTHPQGFSQWTDGKEGKHLGKKITWEQLPKNIQKHVIDRLKE